jgi:hypothetical protein
MRKYPKKLALLGLLAAAAFSAYAQQKAPDTLYQKFVSPPASAKPRVWWHWMNGNITKEGIKLDLLWMKRSGIGGFQNFDAAMLTPQIVKNRLVYMTPEWKDAFKFTTKLADSLHLEMAIAGSPGWSESGGPWVPAQNGMKKVVWTQTYADGGKPFSGIVPKPAETSGPFQNIPLSQSDASNMGMAIVDPPHYYKDIAVFAYKIPEADVPLSDLNPVITSSGGSFNVKQLSDGDLATTSLLPPDTVGGFGWIQFAFDKPQTIKAITIVGGGDRGPFGLFGDLKDNRALESSDDGQHFTRICFIPAGNVLEQTLNITPTTAKYFRVTFKNPPPTPDMAALFGLGTMGKPKPSPGTQIAEINLHAATVVDRFEEKAAYATSADLYKHPTPSTPDVIQTSDIIDLTSKMGADGSLNWTPPQGKWNIMRFGYSLTGITNHPATQEATGLEVDKLDSAAVRAYFEHYLDMYKDATGGLMGSKGGLQYMVTDSWEAGTQNWTPNMAAEFQKRRGYNMLPWMPVLAGHIVKSSEASEQFLWDFRKTLAELVAENHYDLLTKILRERGMKRYSESHEDGRALIADGMDVKRKADIPMSAMWTPSVMGDGMKYKSDIRESASVAHIYGQNLVAAESMTAFGLGGTAWSFYPEKLKPTADLELASGLNRFVIHTSVHQPTDDKIPGLGLGPFGQWFNRHDTWAEEAIAWTSYLSRSSYLLQQGKFVADVVYYYGEDNNITALFGKKLPDVPEGYNYDFINSDALLNLLSVKDHELVTQSGMHYKVLALDSNSTEMPLKVLKKINDLVNAGATVTGPRPVGSPSLSDDDKTEYARLVNSLWGTDNTSRNIGQGKVYSGQVIGDALKAISVAPDFSYKKPDDGTTLLYVHRKLKGSDIYWINNRSDKAQNVDGDFRITGRNAEIWHPETSLKEEVSYASADGRTTVPLHLEPNDAIFVVFKGEATLAKRVVPNHAETPVTILAGTWTVRFQKDRGAPEKVNFDSLTSWADNTNAGIKYFSGTAVYTKSIDVKTDWLKKGSQLWLDLGDVKNLAQVTVNGKNLGIVWKKPFKVNLAGALKPGKNLIEVKVTNLWVNRLIGDQQASETKKYTYTTMPFYNAKSPLSPSGLLGPVQIVSIPK